MSKEHDRRRVLVVQAASLQLGSAGKLPALRVRFMYTPGQPNTVESRPFSVGLRPFRAGLKPFGVGLRPFGAGL